ncbi:hypothetical protein SteCoe_11460 [Stentor coeruleus]|uniref:Uncharacterized protein n=1 Tax=Stentor coeruleus TaxID=5963 RepID=A0A1R2CD31_9CILI|nr:hypothetical protein SteCoe_11460 [Stentor coeruleus]
MKRPSEVSPKVHSSSVSSGFPFLERPSKGKDSIDVIDEIRKEQKDRETRRLEREKEIEEICHLDSSDDKESPYVKAVAETTTTVPSPRKTEEFEPKPEHFYICCCKKFCQVI